MHTLGGAGTRVLLIGTGTHHAGSGLEPVHAALNSVTDLGQKLVERCGLAPDALRVVHDPAGPTEMGLAIAETAEQATDVLLVYYAGHGLVSPGGELYLATTATDPRPSRVAHTALAYTAVRNSLLDSDATATVVVLDCCFSGRALGVLGDEVELAQVHGGFVLTSAARNELALAPVGQQHTAFTGELIRLLVEGDKDGPPGLTLGHAYRYLSKTLPAKGFPRPHRRASGWVDDLLLCPNPAYQAPKAPPADAQPPAGKDICPYPGLAPFGPGEVQWFFGRERLTAQLVGRLTEKGPLIVVGASGAGKSSLLGAGLLPALDKGLPGRPESRTWPRLAMTPTATPMAELAKQLATLSTAAGDLVAQVREVLAQRGDAARLVIVVDQFEEVFTQCTDEAARATFIESLCAADALVVISVRADFYDRCAAYSELVPALQHRQLLVGPMSTDELKEAIEKPAEVAGLVLQPGLVETLLDDVATGDALPLLSHALAATWRLREGRTLTVGGYQAAGGVKGAIAVTAEETYQRFNAEEQRTARALLLRLVQISETAGDTRRRADRHELPDDAVLDALATARLVTVDEDSVELTHEALLRAWPRLREWIDEDRAGLRVHQQLAEAATAWDRDGRSAHRLYRDIDLRQAVTWSEKDGPGVALSPGERTFLAESRRGERRRVRTRRWLTALGVLLVVVAVVAGVIAVRQGQVARDRAAVAEEQRGLALSRQMAATSRALASTRPDVAMWLAVEAYHRAPTVEARGTLLTADGFNIRARITGRTPVSDVAYSPDGKVLAIAHSAAAGHRKDIGDYFVRLLDATSHRETGVLAEPITNGVSRMVFSPDSKTLATAGKLGKVSLWDVASQKLIASADNVSGDADGLAFSPDGRTLAVTESYYDYFTQTNRTWLYLLDATDGLRRIDDVTAPDYTRFGSVAFSPDGRTLAIAYSDQTIILWDLRDDHQIGVLTGHQAQLTDIAFSPDGATLASTSIDNTIRLWRLADQHEITTLTSNIGQPNRVTFSPDGSWLAAAGDQITAIWDPHTGRQIMTFPGHTGHVTAVAFSPDGRTLATGGDDRSVALWDLTDKAVVPTTGGSVNGVAWSPDGTLIASVSDDGLVRLWEGATGKPAGTLSGHKGVVWGVAFSPDSTMLATGGADQTVRLWNLKTRKEIALLTGQAYTVYGVAFSPDGRMVIGGRGDQSVQMWDVGSHQLVNSIFARNGGLRPTFSPDKTFAVGQDDDKLKVIHVEGVAFVILDTVKQAGSIIGSVFSRDGRFLIGGGADGLIRLWDLDPLQTGDSPVGVLIGHNATVNGLAVSPDGATLASASTDRTVRLWDLGSRRELAQLLGHRGSANDVAFSPDGNELVTAGEDGSLRRWDLDADRVIQRLCGIVGRVPKDQWTQFLPDLAYQPVCH